MEASRQQATLDKKALEGDNVVIKKDIEDLELAIQKLEQEKTNRDHTIRALNDEIANQDEVLKVAQDKVEHLANIKTKLESTLDELNDSLAREKRARADIEKQRRKVEGDL